MSVPGRADAAALLLSLAPKPWQLRHSRAVAEVAAFLAARIGEREGLEHGLDRPLDRRLVEAAALLHDADKALPGHDPARRLRHGDGSAEWLSRQGFPELAPLVAAHPVTRLADESWFHDVLLRAPMAVRIVAYADKRAGQRLESMGERFASWERRYPPRDAGSRADGWDRATLDAVRERARVLELDVCRAAGMEPDEVGRLRWTAAALAAAHRRDATAVPARSRSAGSSA